MDLWYSHLAELWPLISLFPEYEPRVKMLLQMEKQVLEGHLQQVLEQPLSKSGSPATSQQDSAAKRETNKSPDRDQVRSWSAIDPATYVIGAALRSC